jgi:hypothetical protein
VSGQVGGQVGGGREENPNLPPLLSLPAIIHEA